MSADTPARPVSVHDERIGRLRVLTEVSRALTYATSIEEVLHLAVERAAELMQAEKALLMLTDQDGLLRVQAAHGLELARLEHFQEQLSENLVRRLQVVLDYPSIDCFLSVPLVVQGQVTGLLAAVRVPGRACTPDDEWLLSALADQAAVALENARLAAAVQEAHEQRERSARAQGHVHATLSHELRSPLNAIQSYCSLLLDGIYGPLNDRQRESVGRVRTSGQHLLSVLENVLDAARINTGAIPLEIVNLSLTQLLIDAQQMLQPVAEQKRQNLRCETAEDLVVRGDSTRLLQALLNLMGNAIKFTPEGGAISVRLTRSDHRGRAAAAVAVSDSGPGIPPETLPSIFQPYHRGSRTTEPGLGLGLYIARQLVRQMGGDVTVQTDVGKGSTFTLRVPLAG